MYKPALVGLFCLAACSSRGGPDVEVESQQEQTTNNKVGISLKATNGLPKLEIVVLPSISTDPSVFVEQLTTHIAALRAQCLADLEPQIVVEFELSIRDGKVHLVTGPNASDPCLTKLLKGKEISAASGPAIYRLLVQLRVDENDE